MFNEFKAVHTQAEALHKQYRAQVLNTLTPIHRQTVASLIGQLAISANPDKSVTAKQIDVLLSGSERNAILNAHNNYIAQSKKLHERGRCRRCRSICPPARPRAWATRCTG